MSNAAVHVRPGSTVRRSWVSGEVSCAEGALDKLGRSGEGILDGGAQASAGATEDRRGSEIRIQQLLQAHRCI